MLGFVIENRIDMWSEPIDYNPDAPRLKGFHFKCHLTRYRSPEEDVSITVFFSQGPSCVKPLTFGQRVALKQDRDHVIKRSPAKPRIVDVLNCLASDAMAYEQSEDIDDWAGELGLTGSMDTLYAAAAENTRLLKKLLGCNGLFDELLYETEPE
jgi:hypothetical protein